MRIAKLLDSLDAARLDAPLGAVPWFPKDHAPIRMVDTMLQVPMHSQGHRAQNAVRLRELGGSAPLTDYILWVLLGRPAPAWD